MFYGVRLYWSSYFDYCRKNGIQILGVDINPKVVEKTNAGELHIIEPGMEEILKEVVMSGMFRASTIPEVCDAYFMVVPTPFKGNHEPDISYVEAATRSVIPYLKEGDLYVIESTSPVGTTELMASIIYAERPELEGQIYIAYCPERVLPGNVIYELIHNDRVIGGLNPESTEKAINFILSLLEVCYIKLMLELRKCVNLQKTLLVMFRLPLQMNYQ